MKIFDLEYKISSSARKVRARITKAFQKKELSTYLILRYLSIFIIAFNIFVASAPQPAVSRSIKSTVQEGTVLSQEIKAATPKILHPVRIAESSDLKGFMGKSALVLDATTSAVLYEKSSTEKLAPASLTKLMTALLVLDYKKLSDELTVTPNCTKIDGVKVGFTEGQRLNVESLLYSLLLPSAADAACTLSTGFPVPGPEASPSARFVSAMNKKAKDLGLLSTNFTNPVGLDNADHYSTASDMLLLSRKIMENPDLAKIVGIARKKITTVDGKASFDLRNTNELLSSGSGFFGIKTGSTPNALGCLSFLYEKDGHQIIGVILGSPLPGLPDSKDYRFIDAKNLVDWIFKSYEWQ